MKITCSGHDRFVKFNKRGMLISDVGGGRANSEINTRGASFRGTRVYYLQLIFASLALEVKSKFCNHSILFIRTLMITVHLALKGYPDKTVDHCYYYYYYQVILSRN